MSTTSVTTVVVLVASLALGAMPGGARAASMGGDRQEGQAQPRAERRRPREAGGGGERQGGARQGGERQGGDRQGTERQGGVRRRPEAGTPRADGGDRGDRGQPERQAEPERRAAPRREAVPRNDGPRADGREGSRDDGRNRGDDDRRRVEPQRNDRDRDGWRDDRFRNAPRYVPAPRAYRGYSHPPRVYVVPYGYRPQGYRQGWSTNLYFGRPYRYGYPGAYGNGGYGYYSLPQGFAYGSLRIVDAPRDAQVFVDGYYAGVVDDYDGVFQRLNLEPGAHHVEIDMYPGAPPLDYEVYVEPGRTVTIHARY